MPVFSAKFHGLGVDFFLIDERFTFLIEEYLAGLGDGHFAADDILRQDFFQHPLHVEIHRIPAGASHAGDHHRLGLLLDRDLDIAILQFATDQHRPHLFAASLVTLRRVLAIDTDIERRGGGNQQFQQPVRHAPLGFFLHVGQFALADQPDGIFHQLADHALHVAAIVAHLGVLAGFDLDERGTGEIGQSPGDFRLADTGGADHQDVLRRDLFAHVIVELLPPPAVADRDSDGPFGVGLANDVTIEVFDNFAGSEILHLISSITMFWLEYTQISPAISRLCRTISAADSEVCFTKARAAARA